MTYTSEIRIFIISTLALLIIVASAGLFITLNLTTVLNDAFLEGTTVSHAYARQIIERGGDPLAEIPFLEGYCTVGPDGKVRQAFPAGAADYYRTFASTLNPSGRPQTHPWIIPATNSQTPLAMISSLPSGGRLITYHTNPLPDTRRRILIYFAILALVGIGMPILTLIFLTKRVTNPLVRLKEEARMSPVATGEASEEPTFITATMKKTIEELKLLSQREKERADELHVLATTLAGNMPSGLIVTDSEGDVIRMSPAAMAILGLDNPELPSPSDGLLEGWPRLKRSIRSVLDGGEPRIREEMVENDRHLAATVVPLRDEEGAMLGTLTLFVDRSEMIALEEELRRQKNMAELGLFASGIAHQFRNAMATIKGFLDLYRRREKKEYLDDMEGEIAQILTVTTRFLAFSQDPTPLRENVEVKPLLEGVVRKLAALYPDVTVSLNLHPCRTMVDPTLFEQALRNIIENAFQAGRQIAINLDTSPERVTITIEDDGPGIPPEIIETLYLPFVTGRSDGAGLGLAIAYRIITRHGGGLRHENRPRGGTLCEITLPCQSTFQDSPGTSTG